MPIFYDLLRRAFFLLKFKNFTFIIITTRLFYLLIIRLDFLRGIDCSGLAGSVDVSVCGIA